jgi:hypothetical protein
MWIAMATKRSNSTPEMLDANANISPKSRVKSVTADVDWLTITSGDEGMRDRLYGEARKLAEEFQRQKAPIKPWSWMGYSGWKCDGFRSGSRADSDIVMLSGAEAARWWSLFAPLAGNCSRLDLAVTVDLIDPFPEHAAFLWQNIPSAAELAKLQLPRFTYITNTDGGDTIYVGSRSSAHFGRVYDKGVESKTAEPGKLWRYEVEYKKPLSKCALTRLIEQGDKFNQAQAIRNTVFNWFWTRQIAPIFEAEGLTLQIEYEARVTSDDTRLNWLSQQVSKSVGDLVARGKGDAVLEALGLDGRVEWTKEELQNA